jgi:hypothetical protein
MKVTKEYYLAHKEQRKQYDKRWFLEHPEQIRELWKKHFNKRERTFDFIPLNKFFEGSVAHHLDKVYVVYMDKETHQGIKHSVLKNMNMNEINAIAFNYI